MHDGGACVHVGTCVLSGCGICVEVQVNHVVVAHDSAAQIVMDTLGFAHPLTFPGEV